MTTKRLTKVDQVGPVRRISFNRPEAANAFTFSMLAQLATALDAAIADDKVGAIIIAGEGQNFQSGIDLAAFDDASMDEVQAAKVTENIHLPHRIAKALYECPKPTVAALQGAVLTMGCELSLYCDFRIVTPQTFFYEKWVKMGVIPALGGLKLLPALIGMARAKQMILGGEKVYGAQAVAIGLATRCVEFDGLQQAALDLATELAGLSAGAYRHSKELLSAGATLSLDDLLTTCSSVQADLAGSEEFRRRHRR